MGKTPEHGSKNGLAANGIIVQGPLQRHRSLASGHQDLEQGSARKPALPAAPGDRDAGVTRFWTAPAGGAQKWGRGCQQSLKTLIALMVSAAALPAFALEEPIELPSGLEAEFHEMRIEVAADEPALVRFRFVSEAIEAAAADLEALSSDFDYLCTNIALPAIPVEYRDPRRIVISIGSEASEFGTTRPDIVQVFEAYSVAGDRCIWEAF